MIEKKTAQTRTAFLQSTAEAKQGECGFGTSLQHRIRHAVTRSPLITFILMSVLLCYRGAYHYVDHIQNISKAFDTGALVPGSERVVDDIFCLVAHCAR